MLALSHAPKNLKLVLMPKVTKSSGLRDAGSKAEQWLRKASLTYLTVLSLKGPQTPEEYLMAWPNIASSVQVPHQEKQQRHGLWPNCAPPHPHDVTP